MVGKKIVLLLLILLIPAVSAEVWFMSQPEPLYNIGDTLEVSVSVSELGSQLDAELFCTNRSKMIFLNYLSNKTLIKILQPLTKNFLGEIQGKCEIVLTYKLKKEISSDFIISDRVFLDIETEKQDYNPGEKVNIEGKVEKANTQLLNGFFEIHLEKINFTITGPVNKGRFETNLSLPEDIAAGFYSINIIAYEKEGEEITNTGNAKLNINIKQMPKKIDAALNSQNVHPGENLSFKIMLYDQSDTPIKGEASFLIENSEEEPLVKDLAEIGEDINFFPEKNLSAGYYRIKVYSSGIYEERQFYVEENEEAEFKLVNDTLVIKNIGNVKYSKAVQVKIGEIVEIINDELVIGGEKKYGMIAPDGTYDVVITDGLNSLLNEGIALTGNAVAIKEIDKGFFSKNKILAWSFLILVLGMFIFVSGRRILKKKFVLSDKSASPVKGKGVIKAGPVKAGVIKAEKTFTSGKNMKEAEHSLVLKGQKHDTAIVCLKIKNELNKATKLKVDKILEKVHENKAVIYRTGEYVIPIFSPLATRTFKNHVPAVKTALGLAKTLYEHNSRFSDKIDFGISVHTGDLVSSLQEGKLKFTSLGNTLNLAKKIADLSEREVLLSKDIHEKTLVDIKTDKMNRYGLELFKVKRITDSQRNKVFIQDFLKKLAGEGKKN